MRVILIKLFIYLIMYTTLIVGGLVTRSLDREDLSILCSLSSLVFTVMFLHTAIKYERTKS